MQLDRTFIAIRERDFVEVLDLSLHVIRVFIGPLLVALAAGIVPVAWACHYLSAAAPGIYEEYEWRWLYALRLVLLAVLAAPLATAPATLLLGQVLFQEKPHAGRIVRDLVGSLPQLFLFQVLFRTVLVGCGITSFLPFAFWPYLNEIVLLERNPLSRGRRDRISTFRRSGALHGGSAGDLFGRWILSTLYAAGLVMIVLLALWGARQWLTGVATIDRTTYVLGLQISLWTVVAYFAVVRFLSYLDLRIRREGWEVELKMRAEAARLTSQLV